MAASLRSLAALAAALLLSAALCAPAAALDICGMLTQRTPRVVPASVGEFPHARKDVRLAFVGHSTFLIESPGGVKIATDYNDYVRPAEVPDIATMNRAHRTHYTDAPDSRIAHVLRGWDPAGGVARHDVIVGDVRVRNVPTNIRDWGGESSIRAGNSIFVFEMAGLCIVHLGHLHQTLGEQLLAAIGRVDVVLVPVDGNYTLDIDGTMEVLRKLEAKITIPMHFFGPWTLDRFIQRAEALWPVERSETPSVTLSRALLPAEPRVLVLPGR